MDPITYFTGAALLPGVIETGKMALSGVIGNSVNTAVWRAIPEIHQWYQGEGQPVNHDLQRALRTAYLAATEQLLEQARREVDEDTVPWCYRALQWVKNQSDLLKDETYRPPVPPDGWEPAHIVEPTAKEAAAGVAALRESLSRMLIGEWTAAGLRTPPESIAQALTHGWRPADGKADWFDLISL